MMMTCQDKIRSKNKIMMEIFLRGVKSIISNS